VLARPRPAPTFSRAWIGVPNCGSRWPVLFLAEAADYDRVNERRFLATRLFRKCSWATVNLDFEHRKDVETLNRSQKAIPIPGRPEIQPYSRNLGRPACLRRSPPPPRRSGRVGGKKSGNRWFFLTGRRFDTPAVLSLPSRLLRSSAVNRSTVPACPKHERISAHVRSKVRGLRRQRQSAQADDRRVRSRFPDAALGVGKCNEHVSERSSKVGLLTSRFFCCLVGSLRGLASEFPSWCPTSQLIRSARCLLIRYSASENASRIPLESCFRSSFTQEDIAGDVFLSRRGQV